MRALAKALPALALAVSTVLAASTLAARAADPVYPPGSRIGLEPAGGVEVAKRFLGFEKPGGLTVAFFEMPEVAFRDLNTSFTADNLKQQAFTLKNREDVTLPEGRRGVLLSGEQAVGTQGNVVNIQKWLLLVADPGMTGLVVAQSLPGLDADGMRGMLTSVRLRGALSVDDQVAALPFKVGNRAGFRPVRVLGGNSVLFTEGPQDQMVSMEQPILVVADAVQPPPAPEQREAFARAALASNQTIKDFAIERSQAYRQGGADWHEVVARGVDIPSGAPVIVSQTIRFRPDGYLRAVGIARLDARDKLLPRFRQVVDSLEPK
jgi:hypothetical protein